AVDVIVPEPQHLGEIAVGDLLRLLVAGRDHLDETALGRDDDELVLAVALVLRPGLDLAVGRDALFELGPHFFESHRFLSRAAREGAAFGTPAITVPRAGRREFHLPSRDIKSAAPRLADGDEPRRALRRGADDAVLEAGAHDAGAAQLLRVAGVVLVPGPAGAARVGDAGVAAKLGGVGGGEGLEILVERVRRVGLHARLAIARRHEARGPRRRAADHAVLQGRAQDADAAQLLGVALVAVVPRPAAAARIGDAGIAARLGVVERRERLDVGAERHRGVRIETGIAALCLRRAGGYDACHGQRHPKSEHRNLHCRMPARYRQAGTSGSVT